MKPQRAREILNALISGIDPETQRELPKGTVLANADVIRALLVGVANIEQAVARDSRRAGLPRNIGRTWTEEENGQLVDAYQAGESPVDIALRHGRTVRAIEARLEKLGLLTAEQRTTVDRFGAPVTAATNGADPRSSHSREVHEEVTSE